MIKYTLLPEIEERTLKREYKTRLFIVLLLFLSLSVVAGIIFLLPSYMLSYSQESKAIENASVVEKGRQERGIAQVEKELTLSQKTIDLLLGNMNPVKNSLVIQEIISNRPSGAGINSFNISKAEGTSTPITAIIQGKADSRESLIEFKKNLENDETISKVELPISDLAKNKDISFSIRLEMKQ